MSRDEKLLNFQLRYQPKQNSRYAPLINYYNEGDYELEASSRTEFVFKPVEAFWLPFALENQGASPEEIQKALARSIYALQSHIGYLQYRFSGQIPVAPDEPQFSQSSPIPTPPTEPSLSVVTPPVSMRSLSTPAPTPQSQYESDEYEDEYEEEDTDLPEEYDDDVDNAFG